ncbi:MAG TPA: ATP:cob(I)alamin adenosyltransferase [Candidatus Saccharimonadales bacterium]|nr:ATP:cob(I)alamin adenosyltransferase [Candidatus Saccharimonadales bacterium]
MNRSPGRDAPEGTRVYTRLGDDGTTGMLFGGRLSKADTAVDAYGTVDEAGAALGVARAGCGAPEIAQIISASSAISSWCLPTWRATRDSDSG